MGLESIVSPSAGERALVLTPADPLLLPVVGVAYSVAVSYSRADELGGVRLPLIVTVGCPNPSDAVLVAARVTTPETVSFTPTRSGRYYVTVRELYNLRLWGAITIDVE